MKHCKVPSATTQFSTVSSSFIVLSCGGIRPDRGDDDGSGGGAPGATLIGG